MMTQPDPHPVGDQTDSARAPIDPAVVAEVTLVEAEYLRVQAELRLSVMPAVPDIAHRDLSPLGI